MKKNVLAPFSIRWITRTAILLAITLAFQMLGFPDGDRSCRKCHVITFGFICRCLVQ